jgi:hypothetical protein
MSLLVDFHGQEHKLQQFNVDVHYCIVEISLGFELFHIIGGNRKGFCFGKYVVMQSELCFGQFVGHITIDIILLDLLSAMN